MAETTVHDGVRCVMSPCSVVCMAEDHEHFDRVEAWTCTHPHDHAWDANDYCSICGADGRA